MQVPSDYTTFKFMNTTLRVFISKAFSMIELMTVIAIIALLAAITIPGFLHNIATTKINALWKLSEPAKLYVESEYLKNNTAVTAVTVDSGTKEFTTADPDLVKCITIQGGVVSVVGNPDSFYGHAYWVSWTPTVTAGQLTWACTYDAAAQEYIAPSVTNCTTGSPAFSADSACN